MKRSVDNDATTPPVRRSSRPRRASSRLIPSMAITTAPPRRHCPDPTNKPSSTASTTRHIAAAAAEQQFMATPQLRALPVVLSSGFLYQCDCLAAAATCQNWCRIWKEVEDFLPVQAKIEVYTEDISGRTPRASWIEDDPQLKQVIGSPEFVSQVFKKVIALKVAAKKGRAARARAAAAMPLLGVHAQVAHVLYWGPNQHNDGGISIRYGKKNYVTFSSNGRAHLPPGRGSVLHLRLNRQLRLWTGIRSWRVYDGQPLWP